MSFARCYRPIAARDQAKLLAKAPGNLVTAADAGGALRNDPQSSGDSLSRQAYVDSDAASIVYQVVDNRTSLVVKQFPDEAMLRRRAYFRTLDLMKIEREQDAATDRRA